MYAAMSTLRSSILLSLAFLAPTAWGLRFHESKSQPPKEEEVREHSVVKILGRSPKTDDEALRAEPTRMSSEQCQEVTRLLRTQKDTSLASRFFEIACEDQYQCEAKLPDMSHGCLIASKDRHLKAMLSTIGRPNPCAFSTLFFNSFFGIASCPGANGTTASVNSQSGVSYGACTKGLTTQDEGCATLTEVSVKHPGLPDIYTVDAVIGLPRAWENAMNQYRSWHLARKDEKDVKPAPSTPKKKFNGTREILKVKWWSCPITSSEYAKTSHAATSWNDPMAASRNEITGLIADQLNVLNTGFSSGLQCKHQVYKQNHGDTGVEFSQFEDEDLTQIDDNMCEYCESYYEDLWSKYMKEERGVLKVLLCSCYSLLGVSAFPWSNTRGTMFDYRTLPNGGMHNYDEGKTMVHEFGHYFGLWHTFQDGCSLQGDEVEDTNPEMNPFFGCPNENEEKPMSCDYDAPDPVNNFMDYADDRCMCSFTPEQRDRVWDNAVEYIYEEMK